MGSLNDKAIISIETHSAKEYAKIERLLNRYYKKRKIISLLNQKIRDSIELLKSILKPIIGGK